MDARYKPWAIHTGKLVGYSALAAGVSTLAYQVSTAFFAAEPIAQVVVYGLTILGGIIAKSPYFKGDK